MLCAGSASAPAHSHPSLRMSHPARPYAHAWPHVSPFGLGVFWSGKGFFCALDRRGGVLSPWRGFLVRPGFFWSVRGFFGPFQVFWRGFLVRCCTSPGRVSSPFQGYAARAGGVLSRPKGWFLRPRVFVSARGFFCPFRVFWRGVLFWRGVPTRRIVLRDLLRVRCTFPDFFVVRLVTAASFLKGAWSVSVLFIPVFVAGFGWRSKRTFVFLCWNFVMHVGFLRSGVFSSAETHGAMSFCRSGAVASVLGS